MNYLKITSLIICAFLLALLDTSYFSQMPIFGATILSSLALVLALSIAKELKPLLAYSISVVIFFSVFSSLPIWLIFLALFCAPYFIYFVRKKYFPDLTTLLSLPFFIVGTAFFSTILLFYNKGWSANGAVIFIYFVLINSGLGVGLFYLLSRWEKDFGRKEIKF